MAVPVLRAGLGMLDAFLELVPSAQVGYFGLERNEETAVARRYYEKVPKRLEDAIVFLLDPMLATGGSAALAVDGLRSLGARHIRLLSVVAAPEGVAHLEAAEPGTEIYTAAVDRALNDRKFIVPGLGDFGVVYSGRDQERHPASRRAPDRRTFDRGEARWIRLGAREGLCAGSMSPFARPAG